MERTFLRVNVMGIRIATGRLGSRASRRRSGAVHEPRDFTRSALGFHNHFLRADLASRLVTVPRPGPVPFLHGKALPGSAHSIQRRGCRAVFVPRLSATNSSRPQRESAPRSTEEIPDTPCHGGEHHTPRPRKEWR